jgi:hypothetical protein
MIKKATWFLPLATPSGLHAGDWVEVKSKEEILSSLDEHGNLDGMPFMPEMLEYCGRRFRVYKRAHKTCDYSKNMECRRVPSAVHLEALRCTGEAHGGCQAECLLFWKEAWLKPIANHIADPTVSTDAVAPAAPVPGNVSRCTEADLHAWTRESTDPEPVYSCQATRIPGFGPLLRGAELDQYVEAYTSGNYRLREMFAPLVFRVYDRVLIRSRLGAKGITRWVYDLFQRIRGGIPYPNRPGMIPSGQKTPRGEPLNLQPGDVVRVKSFKEILSTINREGLNRGLLFSQELVPYCGHVARVHSRVSRIIDEKNGKMLNFGNECIILENVICQARYNAGLSFCPRANYPYWREIWLERVAPGDVPEGLLPLAPSRSSPM